MTVIKSRRKELLLHVAGKKLRTPSSQDKLAIPKARELIIALRQWRLSAYSRFLCRLCKSGSATQKIKHLVTWHPGCFISEEYSTGRVL